MNRSLFDLGGVLWPRPGTLLCCWLLFATIGQAHGQFTTIYNVPPDPNIGDGQSIGSDTQLNLFDGGEIGRGFEVGDGASTNVEVNIFGGSVGNFGARNGSTVNISGGSVGDTFHAYDRSVVNISGGSVGDTFIAYYGSTVNITGGSAGDTFIADGMVNISGGSFGDDFFARNSVVDISGGSFGNGFSANVRGTVNISGGSFGSEFKARDGSAVNLFGTQFVVDNTDIARPSVVISSRDVTLSGLLSDGSPFAFDLNSTILDGHDYFSPDATLTVTLVQPGDANADGLVNIDDLNAVRNHFGETGNADGTLPGDAVPWDGVVDIDDLNAVRNNFGAGAEAVPEPAAMALALLSLATCWIIRPQRLVR